MANKPNTLEDWYQDALRFLRHRYRYLDDIALDDLESRFAVEVARTWGKFDPTKGKAFAWLCYKARAVAHYAKLRSASSPCLMSRGVRQIRETTYAGL